MTDKHGQAIGGIKSQMKMMRERLAKLESRYEDDVAGYDEAIASIRSDYDNLLANVKELQNKVFLLCWSLYVLYGTLLIAYLKRFYG